ncbi:MAG: Mrp/NBP35 family ATP-binding protein [Planctomycetota bacterium]
MGETTCGTCNKPDCSARQPRADESLEDFLDRQALAERMCRIKKKIVVLSGKGGVGKSTVAVNLAVALSLVGRNVGLLDVDIHGPSIPGMLRIQNARVQTENGCMFPVEIGSLKVMSIGFLLADADQAVIWRGPMKMGVIKQFLKDVEWGELDYLIVDCPPGTGDEPLSVIQLIENADGAVVVTTPQEVALLDVRKAITFCRQVRLPVLGVIENMSGFVCPQCGGIADIFKKGGGEEMAAAMNVSFLGRVPITRTIVESGDAGRPCVYHYAKDPAAEALQRIAEALRDMLERTGQTQVKSP